MTKFQRHDIMCIEREVIEMKKKCIHPRCDKKAKRVAGKVLLCKEHYEFYREDLKDCKFGEIK